MKSTIKKITIASLTIILVVVLAAAFIFRNDIRTLMSIKEIDDYGMYYMDYYSDYGLDELIDQGGASSDKEIVEFAVQKILKGIPLEFNVPDFGCTTFQAKNSDEEWIFARNYDLDYTPSMIIKTEPENGYASVSVANISIMGYGENSRPDSLLNSIMTLATPYTVMDGMNEKGFSIGVLIIEDVATNQTGKDLSMTTTSAIRYMLDKAATVEEAIALFENMNMNASSNISYHFQIADASGDSAIIEYLGNDLSVIRKGEGTPMALTNFIVSEEKYGFGKGHDRYDIVVDSLDKSNSVMEMEDAMDVLQSVSKNSYDETTGEGSNTQWSVVYNNSNLSMDICAGGKFDEVYTLNLFD